MAKILEAAEHNGDTIYTVRSERGKEYLINADALAKAWVDFKSRLSNEREQGWNLSAQWFDDEFEKINRSATVK